MRDRNKKRNGNSITCAKPGIGVVSETSVLSVRLDDGTSESLRYNGDDNQPAEGRTCETGL